MNGRNSLDVGMQVPPESAGTDGFNDGGQAMGNEMNVPNGAAGTDGMNDGGTAMGTDMQASEPGGDAPSNNFSDCGG